MARKNKPVRPEKHWLNRKSMAKSLGITGQGFDQWKVKPIAKIGREKFYTAGDVLANRLAHHLGKMQAKFEAVEYEEGESLSPVKEKAMLDREKRIGQELLNDKMKGDVFPVVAAEFVFSKMGAEIAAILESLPAKIKRLMPKMTATQINVVKKEIAKARNSAVDINDKFDDFLEEHYS